MYRFCFGYLSRSYFVLYVPSSRLPRYTYNFTWACPYLAWLSACSVFPGAIPPSFSTHWHQAQLPCSIFASQHHLRPMPACAGSAIYYAAFYLYVIRDVIVTVFLTSAAHLPPHPSPLPLPPYATSPSSTTAVCENTQHIVVRIFVNIALYHQIKGWFFVYEGKNTQGARNGRAQRHATWIFRLNDGVRCVPLMAAACVGLDFLGTWG